MRQQMKRRTCFPPVQRRRNAQHIGRTSMGILEEAGDKPKTARASRVYFFLKQYPTERARHLEVRTLCCIAHVVRVHRDGLRGPRELNEFIMVSRLFLPSGAVKIGRHRNGELNYQGGSRRNPICSLRRMPRHGRAGGDLPLSVCKHMRAGKYTVQARTHAGLCAGDGNTNSNARP